MSMTRKDYVALAAVINQVREQTMPELANASICASRYALRIADMLAADNPRFDRQRFLKACGVQS